MNEYGNLLEVQRLDSAIDLINRRLAVLPETATWEDAKKRLAAAEYAVKTLGEDLHSEERIQTRLEEEIASLTGKIEHEQQTMMSGAITNPKELQGFQAEVRSLSARRDALETELLEQMEETDEVRARGAEAARKRAALAEEELKSRQAHEEVGSALVLERSSLTEERDQKSSKVGAELLVRYEKLKGQLRGVAVGKLEESTCGACRVDLPMVELTKIAAADTLERCPECRRLLVTDRLLGA
jgi:hypothetical protein